MNSITKLIFMKLKATIIGTKRIGDTYYIYYTVGDKIDCMIDLKVFDDGHEDCKIWLVR